MKHETLSLGGRGGLSRQLALVACAGALFSFLLAESRSQGLDPRPSIARDTLSAPQITPQLNPADQVASPAVPFEGDGQSEWFGDQVILMDVPIYDPWTVTGDAGIYRTDNVALSPVNELDDTYFRLGAGVSYDPQLSSQWFGHVHLDQEFFLYDQFDVLDFDYLDAGVGLTFFPSRSNTLLDAVLGDSRLFLNYGYDRTGESGFGARIFDNHAIMTGWQKAIALSPTHTIFLGYVADLSLEASSDLPRRHEHSLSAAYRVQWSPKIFTTLSWQSSWHDYFSFGREDWNHNLSLVAEARLTDQLSLYGSVSWTQNASNLDVFDYERFEYGGLIGLRYQFGGKRPEIAPGATPSSKNPVIPEISK